MRKKYDYLFIINDLNLGTDFRKYASRHKNISFNRQARAFLKHKHIKYQKPCYEVGQVESYREYINEIVHASWLD